LRLACVNSYGAAGSNAAILVSQKPENAAEGIYASQRATMKLSKYPLFVSAASANSLSMYCEKLLNYVKDLTSRNAAEIWLPDLTFNLADRANRSLPHVISTTIANVPELENKLAAVASGSNTFTNKVAQNPTPVVLVFGGQESDFIGVSEELYRSSWLFRHHLDQCNRILISLEYEGLYPAIFQPKPILNL